MDPKKIRKGNERHDLNRRNGFPERDETMDDADLKRATYLGLPPDLGVSYGEGSCEKCGANYITHSSVRPFCGYCGHTISFEAKEVTIANYAEKVICSVCKTEQLSINNCILCGTSIKGEEMAVKKSKKRIKAEDLDVDEKTLEGMGVGDDEVQLEIDDDDDDEATSSDTVTAVDEELNPDKSNPPDVESIDEQLNEDVDKTESTKNLNVKAGDMEDPADKNPVSKELGDGTTDDMEDGATGIESGDIVDQQDAPEENDGVAEAGDDGDDDEDDKEDVEAGDGDDDDELSIDEDEDVESTTYSGDDDEVELNIDDDEATSDDYPGEIYPDDAESDDVDMDMDEDTEAGCVKSDDDESPEEEDTEMQEDDESLSGDEITPIDEEVLDQPVSSEDVVASLHGSDTENPHYCVIIGGVPVAQINLQDQPRPNELVAHFVQEDFAQTVAESIEKFGARKVLESMNAKLYANHVEKSALAKRMYKKAEASLKAEHDNKIIGMTDRFLDALRITIAGYNKNFWPESNELKAALADEFADRLGISNPIPYIEAAFEKAGDEFFETVIAHATDIMGKSDETVEEYRRLVADASTQIEADSTGSIQDERNEIQERLTAGNVNVSTAHTKADTKPRLHLGNKARLELM